MKRQSSLQPVYLPLAEIEPIELRGPEEEIDPYTRLRKYSIQRPVRPVTIHLMRLSNTRSKRPLP